jgi:hypothetical protein
VPEFATSRKITDKYKNSSDILQNVVKFNMQISVTDQSYIHKKRKSRLNSGNAWYNSVQKSFFFPISYLKYTGSNI